MRPLSFLPLLAACTGAPEETAAEDSGPEGALAEVPEDLTEGWDIESVSCPQGATAYWFFSGEITSDAEIRGTERWFWFFPEDNAAPDCVDSFVIDGKEAATPVPDDPCYSCDRDFTADYVLDSQTCTWDGYESLLDNDDTDRIDEEEYKLALMLDTDPLGGEATETNVWTFVRDDASLQSYNDRGVQDGFFVPDDGVDGPGALTWVSREGLCVEIKEE